MKPLLALTLALLGACGSKSSCDTGSGACDTSSGDTATYDGPTTVSKANWDCTATDYQYDVYTTGWTGGGLLQVIENGDMTTDTPWSEEHPLSSVAYSDYGYWDHLYLDLTILQAPACDRDNYDADDACWKMQEADVNTLWLCDASTEAQLTWAVTVYDYNDPTSTADCVTWGYDTTAYPNCTEFTPNASD